MPFLSFLRRHWRPALILVISLIGALWWSADIASAGRAFAGAAAFGLASEQLVKRLRIATRDRRAAVGKVQQAQREGTLDELANRRSRLRGTAGRKQ